MTDAQTYHLWLLPEEAASTRFSAVIDSLAGRLGAPRLAKGVVLSSDWHVVVTCPLGNSNGLWHHPERR